MTQIELAECLFGLGMKIMEIIQAEWLLYARLVILAKICCPSSLSTKGRQG